MEIKLDTEIINKSMSNAVTSAVADSIRSYDVGRIIKEHVTKSIVNVAIEETVKKALIETDTINLTKSIVREIERSVVSLATHSIKEAMCAVVFQIRKGNGYISDEERKKEIEKIKAELS